MTANLEVIEEKAGGRVVYDERNGTAKVDELEEVGNSVMVYVRTEGDFTARINSPKPELNDLRAEHGYRYADLAVNAQDDRLIFEYEAFSEEEQ